MAATNELRVYPREFDLRRTVDLRVTWSDGHESVFPLALLRRACPCATCRAARQEQSSNKLVVMKAVTNPGDQTVVREAELVGNYAIRFVWKDGHDTGIYAYGLLRSLCPCEECTGSHN